MITPLTAIAVENITDKFFTQGTSNSSAPRFDYHCALSDALQPSPQAGTWFEAYFEQLLTNANPSF